MRDASEPLFPLPRPRRDEVRVFRGLSIALAAQVGSTMLCAQAAWAQSAYCGSIPIGAYTAGFNCSPAAGTAASVSTQAGTQISNTTGSSIQAVGNGANASIAATGTSIVNGSTATTVNGMLAQVSGASGNASVTFSSGVNTVGKQAGGQHAVALINSASGTSTVTVNADARLDITNTVTDSRQHDGININATGGGDGMVQFSGSGTISTSGGNGVAVNTSGAGNIRVELGSGVSLSNNKSATGGNYAGIHTTAASSGSGTTNIINAAAIQSVGPNASGIYTDAGSGATTVQNTGAISTSGLNGFGIRSASTGGGSISIANAGTISTTGAGGHGIYVNPGTGTNTAVSVDNRAAITVGNTAETTGSRGIYLIGRGTGDVNVSGTGDITILGGISTTRAYGIIISAESGNVNVDYSGAVSASGDGAGGIRADSTNGNVTVNYGNNRIETRNANANGIYATTRSTTASVGISAQGTIITHSDSGSGDGTGSGSFGLQALSQGGDVSVAFTGSTIDVNGSGAAILGGNSYNGGTGLGNISISNSGQLIARGNAQQGIRTQSVTGAQTIVNQGAIQTNGAADSQGIQATGLGAASITITNDGPVAALGNNSSGIDARTQGGTVVIGNSKNISAGWGSSAGIQLGGASQALNNSGAIQALSDVAVRADAGGSSGVFQFGNTGQVTGSIAATSSTSVINNGGVWSLRNFADSTGSGTRDTWGVAVSDLGSAAGNIVNNTGTINLGAQPASGIGTFNAAGAYLPLGQGANAPVLGGAVQGQILGVKTFTNSGAIDLAAAGSAAAGSMLAVSAVPTVVPVANSVANNVVGNVLVISGGHIAGQDGSGAFVSNGGTLKLNAVLNEGGANSRSDMLVVDSTRTGSAGATRITVNNVQGAGALTDANGIALVEVLNKSPGASDANAFALDGRAVAGAYEYRLFQGGVGNSKSDGNWYLRSEETPVPPVPPDPPTPLYRPEVAAYLANQRLAGQMFVHSLHDRLGEPQYVEEQGFNRADDKPRSGWLRVVGKWEGSKSADGVFKTSTDSFLLHGGAELAKWNLFRDDGADRGHLGLMGSYGYASTDANARGNPFTAKGKVEGWSVGAYGTWFQNDEQKLGAYVDTWFQYGWFTNRVEGPFLPTVRYNATGWAISGETGYAVRTRSDWVIEPQGQLIYVGYNEDDITEANGTRVNGADSHGWITRLGVRLHRTYVREEGKSTWQPYLTLNWWHIGVSSNVSFNELPLGSMYPSNRYEVKIGTNTQFNRRWTGWANVSGSWGAQSFYQYALRVGVKYTW